MYNTLSFVSACLSCFLISCGSMDKENSEPEWNSYNEDEFLGEIISESDWLKKISGNWVSGTNRLQIRENIIDFDLPDEQDCVWLKINGQSFVMDIEQTFVVEDSVYSLYYDESKELRIISKNSEDTKLKSMEEV